MAVPRTTSTLERHQFALEGVEIVDNTSAHTGNFFAIYFPVATVINTATLDSSVTGGNLNSKSYGAGVTLFLKFSSITLTSGEAHCYKYSNNV